MPVERGRVRGVVVGGGASRGGCGGSSAAEELAGEGAGGIEIKMEGESRSRCRGIKIECPHEYSIFYHIEYEKISSNLKKYS